MYSFSVCLKMRIVTVCLVLALFYGLESVSTLGVQPYEVDICKEPQFPLIFAVGKSFFLHLHYLYSIETKEQFFTNLEFLPCSPDYDILPVLSRSLES
jgi:hypothetical protein